MLDQEQRTSKEGQKLFDKGLELMKLATRQYAKRQVKWVRRRFLARGKDEVSNSTRGVSEVCLFFGCTLRSLDPIVNVI